MSAEPHRLRDQYRAAMRRLYLPTSDVVTVLDAYEGLEVEIDRLRSDLAAAVQQSPGPPPARQLPGSSGLSDGGDAVSPPASPIPALPAVSPRLPGGDRSGNPEGETP